MNSSIIFRRIAQFLQARSAHPWYSALYCLIAYGSAMAGLKFISVITWAPLYLMVWLMLVLFFVGILALAGYLIGVGPLTGSFTDEGRLSLHGRVVEVAEGRRVVTISGLLHKAFWGYVKSYRSSLGGKAFPWFYIFMTFMLFAPVTEGNLLPWLQSLCEWVLCVLIAGQVFLWFAVRDCALHPLPMDPE